ncbi:MAG: hypothetical protein PHG14_06280 [Desulfobacter postgatei]|uniref:hypothetical protein n=1 Tax=Desulfobacter postgatei TaxID=2293 RepID=UPI0023F02B1E|nr:hypothetical protein [Desulfobacter postgatei]MDD4273320.1 hypothetical protein [Desulfobacter postgatei]
MYPKNITGVSSDLNKVKSASLNDPVAAFMAFDFSSACSSVSECVVEMEDGNGAKMRMCFKGKTDFDLLELGKSFWMRRS